MATAFEIGNRIVEAALSGRLACGDRLGEAQLAALFDCSRTIVREALIHLSARGIVAVSPRRGWFLVQLTPDKAREVYEARLMIETGIIRRFGLKHQAVPEVHLRLLRKHLGEQKQALDFADPERRSYLFGDFHVCLARCLGNAVIASRLRDLTVLTSLMLVRYQDSQEAERSYSEHVQVIEALEEGDFIEMERRLMRHLDTWENKVSFRDRIDELAALRNALDPVTQQRTVS